MPPRGGPTADEKSLPPWKYVPTFAPLRWIGACAVQHSAGAFTLTPLEFPHMNLCEEHGDLADVVYVLYTGPACPLCEADSQIQVLERDLDTARLDLEAAQNPDSF